MSSESSRAVKIRLEIEVPQGGVEPVIVQQPQKAPRLTLRPTITEPPQPTIAVPVPTVNARQDAGNWIICAKGNYGVTGRPVFGKVYAKGVTTPSSPPEGDPLWVYAFGSHGQWGVQSSFELPVALSGSGQVNTLVVWNDDDDFTTAQADFMISQSGVTNCQGSGSGSVGGSTLLTRPAHTGSRILVATITHKTGTCGGLPDSFTLVWNGSHWVNSSDVVGSASGLPGKVALRGSGTDLSGWELDFCGVGARDSNLKVVSASLRPFCLVFHLALPSTSGRPPCAGSCVITIMEAP